MIATNNDNVVHAMERGALGGEWPAGWRPALLGGAVQGRSPVVPIPVGGANPVVFLGAQDGGVYAVNGATGGAGPAPWAAPTAIGGIVQAAPGGMFTAFGGARDALFVGTRDAGADNALVALDPDGIEIDRFDNGGGANSIGVISGAATVDYARKRVYFASDDRGQREHPLVPRDRRRPGRTPSSSSCSGLDHSGASRAARSSGGIASTWRTTSARSTRSTRAGARRARPHRWPSRPAG